MKAETEMLRLKKKVLDIVRQVAPQKKQTFSGFVEMAIENELKKAKYKKLLV